jgi:hypothetical protein
MARTTPRGICDFSVIELANQYKFEDNYTGESYEKTSFTHILFRKKVSYWS